MRSKLGTTLLVLSTLMAGSATAQDAKSLLQAADKAVGASAVNSVQYNATGWIRFLGQNFTADQALKLDVTQHVPIHGNPSSQADFEKTVAPAAAAQQQAGGVAGGG